MGAEPGTVAPALAAVRARLSALTADLGLKAEPRLVAVSKTKPNELLSEAYAAGQRDFGENYVQELVDKAPELPEDIRWRYIGALQSNKAKVLVSGVPGLACVETVDRLKIARALDKAAAEAARKTPLDIMLQVNTSGESSKSGADPDTCAQLAREIVDACPHLRLVGLMTIGAPRDLAEGDVNPDFERLKACRARVAEALRVDEGALELSMGMSGDWEQAIRQGSTSVRVGSAIFGARG